MQNLNKKASILLWSIFLSLMISAIFISISVKINKSITENKKITEKIKNNSNIKNKLKSKSDSVVNIKNKEKLIINKNSINIGMKKYDKITLNIDKTTNLNIKTKKGVVFFSTGTNKYIILDKHISFETNTGTIVNLENAGGYAEVFISSEKDIDLPVIKYKILKEIGNNIIEKESGEIK